MMQRVTIIPEDGFVSVDGEGFDGIDLSSVESTIHAVQWYGTEGEVEHKDDRGRATHNDVINSLDPFQPALDAWAAKKAETEASGENEDEPINGETL
jgi:hypothetical protein